MSMKPRWNWVAWAGMATAIAGGTVFAGEIIKIPVTERKVAALPQGPAIEGPLPRPLLIVKLEERGKFPGSPTTSSFWVFDPAAPTQGLHKIFTGPGQGQYLRFITPLFGGYGVATGRLDKEKEPERDGPMFWFNPLDGTSGPSIDLDLWEEWRDAGWMVGEQIREEKDDRSIKRIARYHPLKGIVRTLDLDFSYLNWLNHREALGVVTLQEGERVVLLNEAKAEYEIIGIPPTDYSPKVNQYRNFGISPAGKGCRDGIYAIQGFALWFLPKGGTWHPVIRDVHIVKTFGGMPPYLPARYVGNGRFAVTKTVKDEVAVPKSTPKEDRGFGAAEAVTMLIDGITGRIIKQTEPVIYSENPGTKIPDDWWSEEAKPKPESPKPEVVHDSLFQWHEKSRELRFADDQVVKLGKDDEHHESSDGRYTIIFQQCPRGGGKTKTKIPFRIIDGKTGRIDVAEVVSDYYEAWVEVRWQTLCAESPDPETLKKFQRAGPEPFAD